MVTTECFVKTLEEVYITNKPSEENSDFIKYGRQQGWLEEQDLVLWERNIERRQAARILHEFLRIEFGLEDTRDWSHAHKLKDLYDCRVCAKHIAQVVERGIMKPSEPDRFLLLRPVSEADLSEFINNLKNYM